MSDAQPIRASRGQKCPARGRACGPNGPKIRLDPDFADALAKDRMGQLKRAVAGEIAGSWPEIARLIERSEHGRADGLGCVLEEEGIMRVEVVLAFWVKEAGRAGKP